MAIGLVGPLAALAAPFLLSTVQAQGGNEKKWSVEAIHGPAIDIRFTVDEGTWMSVDVSPDGRTLVFDLLGDLYAVPIGGGKATRLTSGPRWDATPRYSPDGTRILFAADATGSDQLWIMPAAGGTATPVTKEGGSMYIAPAWDPTGQFIFAIREPLPEAFGGGYVMLHVGGGSGVAAAEPGASGVTASADGRWLYYVQGSRIVRMDRRTDEKTPVVVGYEAMRQPIVSRNGKLVAFAATIDGLPRLVVRDLETGKDRIIYGGLDYPPHYGGGDLGPLPWYTFMPDDRSIVFAADGKIRRVDVGTGQATVIPFTADVEQTVTRKIENKHKLADGPFRPKVLHWVQPLGSNELIFRAAGKLYRYDIASRRAAPFANGPGLQMAPAVSPDGRWIVYVDWADTVGGRLMKIAASGGTPTPLGVRPGRYQNVAWSEDGTKLVVSEQRMEADGDTEIGYQFHWLDVARGGALNYITFVRPRGNWRKPAQRATFDATGERIYFTEPASGSTVLLCSISLGGTDKQCVARFRLADELMPSPDGKYVAFTEMHNVYLATLPPPGKDPVDVNPTGSAYPVRLVSPQGDFLYWRDGGKRLVFGWGPTYFQLDVGALAGTAKPAPDSTVVSFELPRVQSKGYMLLTNARIVTMKGDEVIERGDLLVTDGRIAAVGRSGQVRAPAGTRTMDVAGKTIIPGFIDLHAHYILGGSRAQGDLHPEQNPHLLSNLAYGITTWRDVSIRSQTYFALAEMVEAGTTLGPRMHGTGDIFFITSNHCCGQPKDLDDARRIVRNQKALGATSIKEHTVPRRDQVQWIIQASREEGLQVVEDPMRGPRRELRPMVDGATSLEHVYAAAPVKKDVIEMLARTGVFYVPTLVVGGFEALYVTTMQPHDDAKLRRFTPHVFLDRELKGHTGWRMPHDIPLWQSKPLKEMVKGGAKIGMGSHGQLQGLGSHWEVWAMATGGLTSLEAIRSATIWAAEAMGMDEDIGSLEVGKLADLMVLDRNPMVDIKNTNSIRYVMKGGVLWDGNTMDEVWPTQRKRPPGFWEDK